MNGSQCLCDVFAILGDKSFIIILLILFTCFQFHLTLDVGDVVDDKELLVERSGLEVEVALEQHVEQSGRRLELGPDEDGYGDGDVEQFLLDISQGDEVD